MLPLCSPLWLKILCANQVDRPTIPTLCRRWSQAEAVSAITLYLQSTVSWQYEVIRVTLFLHRETATKFLPKPLRMSFGKYASLCMLKCSSHIQKLLWGSPSYYKLQPSISSCQYVLCEWAKPKYKYCKHTEYLQVCWLSVGGFGWSVPWHGQTVDSILQAVPFHGLQA